MLPLYEAPHPWRRKQSYPSKDVGISAFRRTVLACECPPAACFIQARFRPQVHCFLVLTHCGVQARVCPQPTGRSFSALRRFVWARKCPQPPGRSLNALRRRGARMSASPPCRSFTACVSYGRANFRSSPRRAHGHKIALCRAAGSVWARDVRSSLFVNRTRELAKL